MPSWKTILRISLITVGTMFALNQLAAISPTARRLIKGQSVAAVPSNGSPNVISI